MPRFVNRLLAIALMFAAMTSLTADAGAQTLETIVLPVDGQTRLSSTTLELGVQYVLSVAGVIATCDVCGELGDAQYSYYSGDLSIRDLVCGGSVDIGVAINDTNPLGSRFPYWGAYNTNHSYSVLFEGQGAQVLFQYHDCEYADNAGELVIDISLLTVPTQTPTWGAWKARY